LPPKRCQMLTDQQRRQRMQFTQDFHTGRLPVDNLVFCDESRFSMGPDSRWIWRRRGEYSEGIFAETEKYARISIHIWAAIDSASHFGGEDGNPSRVCSRCSNSTEMG
jgi:hypothetical protein